MQPKSEFDSGLEVKYHAIKRLSHLLVRGKKKIVQGTIWITMRLTGSFQFFKNDNVGYGECKIKKLNTEMFCYDDSTVSPENSNVIKFSGKSILYQVDSVIAYIFLL